MPAAADELCLLALFDAIGGHCRALDLLVLTPALYVAAKCLPAAVRVVRRAWPDVVQIEDVKEINAEHFEQWRIKRPRLR